MEAVDPTYLGWAVALGALSAISLPLGSVAGLVLRPRASVAAVLAAFGAGALIAALALELVAPTAAALEHGAQGAREAFLAMLLGAVAGGLLFVALDRALAARGGFLRKASTAMTWFARQRDAVHRALLHDLCGTSLLRRLPAAQVGLLVRDVRPRSLAAGESLFERGDPSDALYFLRRGAIALRRDGDTVDRLAPGSSLGELGLVSELPRSLSAVALEDSELLVLRRDDFRRWRAQCPELDAGVRALATERLQEIRHHEAQRSEEARAWANRAIAALHEGATVPTPADLRAAARAHGGGGLAIWLGMLIDGVPESIVIGSGFLALLAGQLASGADVAFTDVVPYTLIAGLFLSNFPEALSSSVGMRAQGWSAGRVVGLWFALTVITAAGAGLGYAIGEAVPHTALVAVEGVAAGAMLTTIASTMIPEAVHLAGSGARAGLATLAGFLAAVSFKLLE